MLIRVFSIILRSGRARPSVLENTPSEGEHRRAEQAQWVEQNKLEKRALRLSLAVAVASIVAAIAAISGLREAVRAANEAERQANAASAQLEVMRDEQRPWIKIEPVDIGDFLVSSGLGTPQATLLVHFRLTNVGRTPAFNVSFFASGFASPFDPGSQNVIEEQQRLCEKLRHIQLDAGRRQPIFFPGEHIVDADLGPAGARAVTTGTVPGEIARALSGDGKTFWFYLYGCADYALNSGAGDHHQTGFVYQVLHIVPRDALTEVVTPAFSLTDVDHEHIQLRELPSARGQID